MPNEKVASQNPMDSCNIFTTYFRFKMKMYALKFYFVLVERSVFIKYIYTYIFYYSNIVI